eukprot:1146219-Amphidinium_carterae.1
MPTDSTIRGTYPLPITVGMITTTADDGENGHGGSVEARAIRQAGRQGRLSMSTTSRRPLALTPQGNPGTALQPTQLSSAQSTICPALNSLIVQAAVSAVTTAATAADDTTLALNCLAAIRLADAPPQYLQLVQSGRVISEGQKGSTLPVLPIARTRHNERTYFGTQSGHMDLHIQNGGNVAALQVDRCQC